MTTDSNGQSPTLGSRLKFKRKSLGLGQDQLSEVSGVSQRQISSYERDKTEPRLETLERLAIALSVSVEWLEDGDENTDIMILADDDCRSNFTTPHVPVVSWNIDSIQSREDGFFKDYLPIPDVASDESFALGVQGDSMAPHYPAGSVIVVDPNVPPKDGDDVVACIGDKIIFKRLSVEPGGGKFLVPLNPQFPAIPLPSDGSRIMGVVVLQLVYRNYANMVS